MHLPALDEQRKQGLKMKNPPPAPNVKLIILLITATGFLIACSCCVTIDEDDDDVAVNFSRSSFPDGFLFGVGSSSYQYEGAANESGKGLSIWDTFTEMYPEKISDHSSGAIAEEFFDLYKEDIALLKAIGWDSFRFSISWPRVIPNGTISKGINWQGVDFYNNLIDLLLANGIQPFVTLFHWDVPQVLEDEYNGFLSRRIVDDFLEYANFCFSVFGDRVKQWVTINEPNYFTIYGYAYGTDAPGRCSDYVGNCTDGNSGTEPYIVLHNMLLCHASVVKLYRENYQATQNGKIGITINTFWMTPKFQTERSREAASRALDFQFGWVANPVTYGEYPETMRRYVGSRLPKFTKEESEMVKGSLDFMTINYYSARYVDESSSPPSLNLSYTTDCQCNMTTEKDGIPIGQPTDLDWLFIYPEGIRELLLYVKTKYNDPPIFVTENGMADTNNLSLPVEDALRDGLRITYFKLHLSYLLKAIKEGVKVKAFFAWSFLDDFEWADGYTIRFGLTYIDYQNGLKRYAKDSSFWFKRFLNQENRDTSPSTSHTDS